MSDTDGAAPPPGVPPLPPAWSAPGSAPASTPGPTPGSVGGSARAPRHTAPRRGHPRGRRPEHRRGHPRWPPPVLRPLAGPAPSRPTSPGIIALRPLGLGDILEGSFAAMRRNPRTFFGLALLTSLAVLLLVALVGALAYLAATQLGSSGSNDVLLTIGTIGGFTLLTVASAVTSVALTGMLSYPVGEAVLGRKPSIGETWRTDPRHAPAAHGTDPHLVHPRRPRVSQAWSPSSSWRSTRARTSPEEQASSPSSSPWSRWRTWGCGWPCRLPSLVLEELGVLGSLRRSWASDPGPVLADLRRAARRRR